MKPLLKRVVGNAAAWTSADRPPSRKSLELFITCPCVLLCAELPYFLQYVIMIGNCFLSAKRGNPPSVVSVRQLAVMTRPSVGEGEGQFEDVENVADGTLPALKAHGEIVEPPAVPRSPSTTPTLGVPGCMALEAQGLQRQNIYTCEVQGGRVMFLLVETRAQLSFLFLSQLSSARLT